MTTSTPPSQESTAPKRVQSHPFTPLAFVPRTVSYSRLTGYDECSMLFKHQHIDKTIEGYSDSEATRTGSYCHKALEAVLEDETGTKTVPYDELAKEGGIWDEELKKYGLLPLKPRLQTHAHHITGLMNRASAGYKGSDAIRKTDGSVATKPAMTGPWKAAAKALKLYEMASTIDEAAKKAAPDVWGAISLSQVYSESLGIMHAYTHPEAITEILQVELPISELRYLAADENNNWLENADGTPVTTSRIRGPHPMYIDPLTCTKTKLGWVKELVNGVEIEVLGQVPDLSSGKSVVLDILHPFYLPHLDGNGKLLKDEAGNIVFRDDVLFSGYIDLLDRDKDGLLAIDDHKTNGGEAPPPSKVQQNEQFNIYGIITETLTGEVVTWLGMNHLRSNRLIRAKYLRELGEIAMERLTSLAIAAYDLKVYLKHHPDSYGTPCVKKPFRDGDPPVICPGIRLCHPHKAELLGKLYPEAVPPKPKPAVAATSLPRAA